MIDSPQIQQTTTRHTACIHLQVTAEEIKQTFGPAVEELVATLTKQGMPPTGTAFAHHFGRTGGDGIPANFDWEVGFTTEPPVTPAGRVYPNVKGVARWRLDCQNEANEGRYPPLDEPSCVCPAWAQSKRGSSPLCENRNEQK